MEGFKKKAKILFDDWNGIEYLKQHGFLITMFGNFELRAGEITNRLKELDNLTVDLPRIVGENKQVQQLQERVSAVTTERDELLEKVSEKTKPIQQYQSENNTLKDQVKNFSNKIESLEKSNQELQDRKKDLEVTIEELNKTGTDEEEINQIYDRIGTFKKIRNKLRIIELWEGNPEKVLRQIEILHLLEGQMGVGSIKQYIKEMICGKLLTRTSIQGSYMLNIPGYYDFKLDCDKLCELLLGSVYETGVQICMEKIKSEREPDY